RRSRRGDPGRRERRDAHHGQRFGALVHLGGERVRGSEEAQDLHLDHSAGRQLDHAVPGGAHHLSSMVAASKTFARPLKVALFGVPVGGVALAAVAALAGGFVVADRGRVLLGPACFAAVALAERFPVKIGPQQKINLGALPCLVAALLLPPGIGPSTAGLSVLAGNRFVRRSWPESTYNAGNVLAAASLASLIGAIGPTVDF